MNSGSSVVSCSTSEKKHRKLKKHISEVERQLVKVRRSAVEPLRSPYKLRSRKLVQALLQSSESSREKLVTTPTPTPVTIPVTTPAPAPVITPVITPTPVTTPVTTPVVIPVNTAALIPTPMPAPTPNPAPTVPAAAHAWGYSTLERPEDKIRAYQSSQYVNGNLNYAQPAVVGDAMASTEVVTVPRYEALRSGTTWNRPVEYESSDSESEAHYTARNRDAKKSRIGRYGL